MPRIKSTPLPVDKDSSIKSVSIIESEPSTEITADQIDVRRLIDKAVGEQDWIEIIDTARIKAKEGDKFSREFLFKYRFGLPAPMAKDGGPVGKILMVEVEKVGSEGDPVEIIESEPVHAESV